MKIILDVKVFYNRRTMLLFFLLDFNILVCRPTLQLTYKRVIKFFVSRFFRLKTQSKPTLNIVLQCILYLILKNHFKLTLWRQRVPSGELFLSSNSHETNDELTTIIVGDRRAKSERLERFIMLLITPLIIHEVASSLVHQGARQSLVCPLHARPDTSWHAATCTFSNCIVAIALLSDSNLFLK